MKKNYTYIMVAGLLGSAPLMADNVILDDLIVDGSACIGQDCVNGESFGFDTIRLKENNLRIKFDDTSSSASFPSNDWQITANDSANGGANKFSIDDITGGRTPFTIEASAPSNSLYVDDGGRVGLGTSTPVVELHVVDGDSPTLRLEQNGSSGFTPQTWDIAGNETNFFVRDATNGSKLPFKIRPSAPTNSLYINTNGNIGFGTASPDATLDIERTGSDDVSLNVTADTGDASLDISSSGANTKLNITNSSTTTAAREIIKLTNNGGSYITMQNTDTNKAWYITHENSVGNFLNLSHDTGLALGKTAMRLSTSGDMVIAGTLTTTGGTCGGGCDIVFSDNYKLPTIEEHAAAMWLNNYLPAVGPTLENQPINISEKTGRILNELEKAHIYIEQLNNKLMGKEADLALIKKKYTDLNQRVLKLEQH